MSPELLKIKSVPATINYRTIYYSLGVLVLDCLFDYKENDTSNLEEIMGPIKETKLFYLVKRCLDDEPISRVVHF